MEIELAPRPRVNGSMAMTYTLGTAAKATGLAKSTVLRAIKAGRITANKTDTGDWSIDPAELHRVFPPAERGTGATPDATHLEAELRGLREVTALLRAQLDDTRKDRDQWRDQAQAVTRQLADARTTRGGFLSRLFGKAT